MEATESKWYGLEGKWWAAHYFVDKDRIGSRSLCGSRVYHIDCTRFPSSGGTFKRCAECRQKILAGTPGREA